MSNTKDLLDEALRSDKCVLSVIGGHAGEGVVDIFKRKSDDIALIGETFWVMKSPKAIPEQVKGICEKIPSYTIFIEPATNARPTTEGQSATEFSSDKGVWHKLPKKLSAVTGKLDNSATALVFDRLTTYDRDTHKLDLWDYGDALDTDHPLIFRLGCSTVCAIKKDTKSHPMRIKSHIRRIVAVARFSSPYCVWVR